MTERQYRRVLKRAKLGDVVRIRWRDSSRVQYGWDTVAAYTESLDKMMRSLEETAGFFIASNVAYVLIALNANFKHEDEPHVMSAAAVPHESIRSFEILAPSKSLDRGPIARS